MGSILLKDEAGDLSNSLFRCNLTYIRKVQGARHQAHGKAIIQGKSSYTLRTARPEPFGPEPFGHELRVE